MSRRPTQLVGSRSLTSVRHLVAHGAAAAVASRLLVERQVRFWETKNVAHIIASQCTLMLHDLSSRDMDGVRRRMRVSAQAVLQSRRGKKDESEKKKSDKPTGGGGGGDEGGDEGGEPNIDEDEKPLNEYRRWITRVVAGITALSCVLWWLSWPSGEHVSWQTLQEHVDDIVSISVYDRYAQVYLSDSRKAHIGLTQSTSDVDARIRVLLAKRSEGKESVPVDFLGRCWPERFLGAVGVIAWIMPFVFVPLFVMVMSQTASIIVRDTAKAASQMQGSGSRSLTKNKMFAVTHKTDVRFKDIAGMMEPKNEITEIVDFMRNPERYQALGAKIPSGAMLLGPPGTGKTMLAKAVAGEADVPFIPCCGSDFVELYVGMGALRVRQLFELARQQPKCIIYIDEIDAIGTARKGGGNGEQSEQEHTLNELLTQLDGFQPRDKIIVLGSSNVQLSMLDPALVRPGRFDRMINVDSPVISERIEIFDVHLRKLKLLPPPPSAPQVEKLETNSDEAGDLKSESAKTQSESAKTQCESDKTQGSSNLDHTQIDKEESAANTTKTNVTETALMVTDPKDVPTAANSEAEEKKELKSADQQKIDELVHTIGQRMSNLCPGFVGADIANVCNEGAILAARENCDHVELSHLERSIDRVLAGIEHRSRVLSDFEKNVVSHHEAGHAVAGWYLNRADPLMKVSIVPRGGSALGYAQYLPNENNQRTAHDIEDSICVALGGRVAELIFFGHWSTGASDDLRKVTKMAYAHVASFNSTTAQTPPGSHQTMYMKPYGDGVSKEMDDRAKAFVQRCFDKTHKLLLERKSEMEALAKHLLQHEVLTHEDVVTYLGKRPPRSNDRVL